MEESRFKFAVSEFVIQKIAAALNFINMRQYDQQEFVAAGRYGAVLSEIGLPCLGATKNYVAPFDLEVTGVVIQTGIVGSSGSTVLDIHHLTDNGATDNGSIFSVKPAVASTADDDRHGGVVYDPLTGSLVTLGTTPTGITVPTFVDLPFELDQGDALRFDIDSVMGGDPQGIAITLFTRPR